MTTNEPLISSISVTPIRPKNTLIAFCSLTYRGELFLGDIALHTDPVSHGYRLVYPAKVLFNGSRSNIHFPISQKIADFIKDSIVAKYEELRYGKK